MLSSPIEDPASEFKMSFLPPPTNCPQKITSSAQDFVRSTHVNTETARGAIKAELVGRLEFSQNSVFQRLKLNAVSEEYVTACQDTMTEDPGIQHAIVSLRRLIDGASRYTEKELEEETENIKNDKNDIVAVPSKAREKKMYPHLLKLFAHISQAQQAHPNDYTRHWITTGQAPLTAEGDTWSFPTATPDFVLLDIPSGSPQVDGSGPNAPHLWRQRSAFSEIKPTAKQSPVGSSPKTIKPIVTQAGNYARLHMSARPFLLFSVGLLIFGSQFCVAIFDRDGVQFSPMCDMFKDMEIFIRVVRRLTCDMSPVELGHDPSVRLLADNEAQKWQRAAKEQGYPIDLAPKRGGPKEKQLYPAYQVTMGNGQDSWYTLGPPIWSSLSLLGRGTSVWRVCDSEENEFILKNSWRSSERVGESTIYRSIGTQVRGLAEYVSGGDVVFPGDTQRVVSVLNLRDDTNGFTDGKETAILHRLLLNTVGRPLWEFRSPIELLEGLLAALSAHKTLYERHGILHRDISAGNIMLAVKGGDSEPAGFLMDIEYAHTSSSNFQPATSVRVPYENATEAGYAKARDKSQFPSHSGHNLHTTFDEQITVKRGAPLTGTLQFMAYRIVTAIQSNQTIIHAVHHDIEAFIWVFYYSLLRGLLATLKGERHTKIQEIFIFLFGHMRLDSIRRARHGASGLTWLTDFFPKPLLDLFSELEHYLELSHLTRDPQHWTYDLLEQLLQTAIDGLKASQTSM
ncbi:hypothetical protein K439DRAFT_1657964 [Ramaria rubella]|nr:hypothetical protein K439DRAFT_1657964 [Ramaria rubella]